jgi:multiple sugar transport system substrate-binding protein
MHKKLLLVALVLMLALATSVTMAQDDLSGVDPSGQTVVYWHQFSDTQLEAMTALVDQFNSSNEYGITVEAVGQGNYDDIRALMSAAITSGELPNLVAGFTSDAASYYNDNAAVDLRTYINDPTWGLSADEVSDIKPALLSAVTVTDEPYNGAILGWPHQNSAQVLVVNTTMLNELGFENPPQTLEEFKDVACAASEMTGPNDEDIQGFPISGDSSELESFVAAQGGAIYHDGAYDFTSDAAIATLQLYHDLYAEGCGYIPAERFGNTADFALGLNPMATTSTAGLPFILGDFANSGVEAEWQVTTVPFTEGNQTVQIFVPTIIMVPSTPEKELASWLFLKYLATPEATTLWSTRTGYYAPSISGSESITAEDFPDANLFPYFEAASELQTNPDIKLYSSPNTTSYGTVRGLVAEAIANVTSNGQDVQATAEQLQEDANDALADSMS